MVPLPTSCARREELLRRFRHPLLDDLVGKRAVELGEVVELGFVGCQPLALRAELGFEPRQLGLRDQSLDPVPAGPAVARCHAQHLSAPPRASGRISLMTSPNWPWPPDCFLCRPCWRTGLRIDSR